MLTLNGCDLAAVYRISHGDSVGEGGSGRSNLAIDAAVGVKGRRLSNRGVGAYKSLLRFVALSEIIKQERRVGKRETHYVVNCARTH